MVYAVVVSRNLWSVGITQPFYGLFVGAYNLQHISLHIP
jgi:hypothetical protein